MYVNTLNLIIIYAVIPLENKALLITSGLEVV